MQTYVTFQRTRNNCGLISNYYYGRTCTVQKAREYVDKMREKYQYSLPPLSDYESTVLIMENVIQVSELSLLIVYNY